MRRLPPGARRTSFEFKPFSRKQKQILTWWMDESPIRDMDGIIADGAIRSGKTLTMSLSFVLWAMSRFDRQTFAMCGKTIGAFRRNVLYTLKAMLSSRGYVVDEVRSENLVIVRHREKENYFYIFGGRDERSQDLIQGITLAGVFFDEVALMPESFVNQATGRCSVEGSKFWFNCNPASTFHWFNRDWIQRCEDKKLIHLHLTIEDNLSLTDDVRTRYRSLYTGVFFKRFILGLWVMADGLVYDMFDEDVHVLKDEDMPRDFERMYVGVDYGIHNPTVFLLVGMLDGKYYAVKEYVWDSVKRGRQKTDAEYSKDMAEFVKGMSVKGIYVDPSASSLILQMRRDKVLNVLKASNDVIPGIQTVSTLFQSEKLFISDKCTNLRRSLSNYMWDPKAAERGVDQVIKENDHESDALRYVLHSTRTKKITSMRRQ